MNGGTFIQWLALALCVIFAAMRLPDAVHGKGRSMFAVLVLLSLAVALSLSPIYLFVDGLLGGANLANLVIRISLYVVMLLLGVRCAAAFGSDRARRCIEGPVGIAVLALTVLVTVVLFALSDLPQSSTGLAAYVDQPTVHWYADMGRIYPGYVAACLIGPAFASVRDRRRRSLHRVSAALIGTGLLMVLVMAVLLLFPLDIGAAEVLLPFGGIVLVTVGLTMIWLSRRRAEKDRSVSFLARER